MTTSTEAKHQSLLPRMGWRNFSSSRLFPHTHTFYRFFSSLVSRVEELLWTELFLWRDSFKWLMRLNKSASLCNSIRLFSFWKRHRGWRFFFSWLHYLWCWARDKCELKAVNDNRKHDCVWQNVCSLPSGSFAMTVELRSTPFLSSLSFFSRQIQFRQTCFVDCFVGLDKRNGRK